MLHPGDRVAQRFEIERRAGSGGMGIVFRAVDKHTGEAVALKVLTSVEQAGVLRFAREGRMLAQVEHPGIVRLVAHGEAALPDGGSALYIAVEWLPGGGPRQPGAPHRPPPPPSARVAPPPAAR